MCAIMHAHVFQEIAFCLPSRGGFFLSISFGSIQEHLIRRMKGKKKQAYKLKTYRLIMEPTE